MAESSSRLETVADVSRIMAAMLGLVLLGLELRSNTGACAGTP